MAILLKLNGNVHEVVPVRLRPELVLLIDGEEYAIPDPPEMGCGAHSMKINGQHVDFTRSEGLGGFAIRMNGRTHKVGYIDPLAIRADDARAHDNLIAPMPGAVISVVCAPGDTVSAGQSLMTIESMKLQQSLAAPRAGVIAAIHYDAGATFDMDAVLIAFQAEGEER